MSDGKCKPRGRINLNFDLTDDAQLAIYHVLRAKGAERCATQWIMSHLVFDLDSGWGNPATEKAVREVHAAQTAVEQNRSPESDASSAPHREGIVRASISSDSPIAPQPKDDVMNGDIAEEVADIISVFGS